MTTKIYQISFFAPLESRIAGVMRRYPTLTPYGFAWGTDVSVFQESRERMRGANFKAQVKKCIEYIGDPDINRGLDLASIRGYSPNLTTEIGDWLVRTGSTEHDGRLLQGAVITAAIIQGWEPEYLSQDLPCCEFARGRND